MTAEIVAALALAVLAIVLAIQHETTLAILLAVSCVSFVVDAMRRIRRARST
ncbi:MAG: hypothetical protein HOY79_41510 [Streptomyces sp.]|nr:hypothetical protein [Streptomyces sp.]